MEIAVTWKRAVRVWWSFMWRSVIAMLAAMGLGAIMGFVIGFTLALAGVDQSLIKIISGSIGMVIGVMVSIVPIKMILNKNFGEFRLALVPLEKNLRA